MIYRTEIECDPEDIENNTVESVYINLKYVVTFTPADGYLDFSNMSTCKIAKGYRRILAQELEEFFVN